MQVARLIEQEPTRNLWAKIRQMVHADALEQQLSKDQILTLYLTLAPYGGNIEGIRAASLAYFGKEPTRLTTAEAALLVALPQSPEARRPDRDPAAAAQRPQHGARPHGQRRASSPPKRRRRPSASRSRRRGANFPMLAAHLAQEAVAAQPNARQIELTVDRRLQAALEKLGAARAAQLGPKVSVRHRRRRPGDRRHPGLGRLGRAVCRTERWLSST